MNDKFWNIVRADIHLGADRPMDWYFVRNSKRFVIAGPFRKAVALQIAGEHNDTVISMMESLREAQAPPVHYGGLGA